MRKFGARCRDYACWVLVSLIIQPAFAEIQPEKPTKILLACLEHPATDTVFVPFFEQVYASLGIEPEFVAMPVDRGLLSLHNGAIDGDVARTIKAHRIVKDIFPVGPPLGTVEMILLCQPNVRCDRSIFMQSSVSFAANKSFRVLQQELVGITALAHMIEVESLMQILEMMEKKRVDYAVYHSTNTPAEQARLRLFHRKVLHQEPVYHLLHQRWSPWFTQIDAAIRRELALTGGLLSGPPTDMATQN